MVALNWAPTIWRDTSLSDSYTCDRGFFSRKDNVPSRNLFTWLPIGSIRRLHNLSSEGKNNTDRTRVAVRETGVSRHHGGTIEGP